MNVLKMPEYEGEDLSLGVPVDMAQEEGGILWRSFEQTIL